MNTLVSNSLPLSRQRPVAVPSTLAPATRTAIKLLQNIEGGSLRLVLPDGQHIMLGHGAERATLAVKDERVFRRVLAEGDIGFGESWIDGDWHSEQLAELLTLLAENREQLARAVHGHWLLARGRLHQTGEFGLVAGLCARRARNQEHEAPAGRTGRTFGFA